MVKVVAELWNPHKQWVFLLWRRGGIAIVVFEWEVRVGGAAEEFTTKAQRTQRKAKNSTG